MKRHVPEFEALEDRRLLAASALIQNGNLVITGTEDRDSINIGVTQVITGFEYVTTRFGRMRVVRTTPGVSVTITTFVGNAIFGSTIRYLGFAKSSFDKIVVNSLGRNDWVSNGSAYASQMDGGAGNDSLLGGGGSDWLTGGIGDDSLAGGGGTDRLIEWADTDLTLNDNNLYGLGTDVLSSIEEAALTSGDGGNTFDCRYYTGNCTLTGGAGVDLLMGGSGHDELYGLGNADQLFGFDGDDRLVGGSGADILDGGDGWDYGRDTMGDQAASIALALLTGGDYSIESWEYK